MHHGFSTLSIPNVVGTTDWYDNDSIYTETIPGEGKNSYIDLSVNGQLLADNVTWATSNPGIGIQYQVHVSSVPGYSPQDNPTAPITASICQLSMVARVTVTTMYGIAWLD